MTWNLKRYLLIFMAVLALLLAGFGLGVIPINLFFVKTAISEAALEHLGAELDIRGPLRLRLGFNPSLSASDLSLHAPGHAGQSLIAIEKVKIKPRLLKLLHGDIALRSVDASGITSDYLHGRVPDFLPQVLELHASAPLNKALSVEISGRSGEEIMRLAASGASLNTLLSDPEVYPFTLQLNALSAELRVDGSINQPLRAAELQARLELEVENVSSLLASFELEAPGLDQLSVQSEVRASGEEFQFNDLEGVLNEIPFRLSGLVRNFTSRPWIEIEAELVQVDLARLPGNEDQASTNEEKVFADLQPLYNGLSSIDGRATLQVGQLLNAPFELNKLLIEASLDHGRLSIDHAGLLLAGSEIALQAVLDTGLDCARLDTRLSLFEFDLENLNPLLATVSDVGGHLVETRLSTSSCGVSLDEHIASLQASAALTGVKLRLDNEDLPLEFSRLEADIAWNQPGKISFDGELLGESLSAIVAFGSVEAIRTGTRSPLQISAYGDEFQLSIIGDGALRENGPELDVILAADVPRTGSLHAWLGTAPDSQLSFRGRSRIRLDDEGLFINDLDTALGRSDLRGTLRWAGPDSELPLSANLKSNHFDLDEIAGLFPGTAAPEQKVKRKESEMLDEIDWIERWFSLPAINLNFTVTQLHGALADVTNAKLHANLRDRLIEEGQLSFQFEGIDVTGTLELDLREQPFSIDYKTALSNIDIGRLLGALGLAENVDAHAQSANIRLASEGNSLHQLAVNSRLDSRIEALHWVFEAGPKQRKFDINLSELELTTSPSSNTTWQTSGKLNGSPLKAWMQTPSLHATFDPALDLPITLIVGTGEDVTMLEMIIEHVSKNELRTNFVISGEFTDPDSIDFASLVSPLVDYEFRTRLTVTESEYLASELEARIGSSKASGAISIRQEGSGYRFDIDLNSPFLETDDLVQWTAGLRNAHRIISRENAPDTAQQHANAGILTLANRYLEEFAGQNIFNVRAAVDELRSSGELLGKAQLELKADGKEFRLDPVKITLPGGNVDASYSGKYINGGYEYALDIDIERLEYGGLLRLFDADSEASGKIYLDTSLVSRSPDAAHAVNHLEGNVDLAVFPTDIQAGFLDLWASNLVLALLPAVGSTDKKMNCMVARFEVENGVMKSKNTFLDTTDIIIRARGDIDLAKRQLDLLIAPQAKREKFLSISTPIAVTGPFNDYQVGVAPGGFLTTMFRWYYGLIYVPWKWLTGERYPPDGISTCYSAMDWDLPAH